MTARRPAALLSDRSGASALVTGLTLTTLLGFAGLAVDLGLGYVARRSAQNAADSAAFSGAAALTAGALDAADQARAIAASYGFVEGRGGDQVSVNTPPAAGPFAGQAGAVEVVVSRPQRRFFSGLFGHGSDQVRARAVAKTGTAGNACVVALHRTASAAAYETGTADINLVGCSLFANSSSPTALELKGGAKITAESVGLVGGYSVGSNATLTTTNGVRTGQAPIADPYGDVPVPSYAGCDETFASYSASTTVANGGVKVFCNGLKINSGATVTLSPGVYIIDRGKLEVSGGGALVGDGVTLVLTSSTGADYATLDIRGRAAIDLRAQPDGPLQGLSIFQDRRAPPGIENKINGGASQNIQGAIYIPNQRVVFTGGSSTSTAGCTQLIASEVAFLGNSTLGVNCTGVGVKMAGGTKVKLVE